MNPSFAKAYKITSTNKDIIKIITEISRLSINYDTKHLKRHIILKAINKIVTLLN
ncbi:hypothetical protein GCM10011368_05270 [Hyunsoonleella pacifica]|nr:hypothetical protein GCM10011368_05270 [Hyunsoonleella pacifica]